VTAPAAVPVSFVACSVTLASVASVLAHILIPLVNERPRIYRYLSKGSYNDIVFFMVSGSVGAVTPIPTLVVAGSVIRLPPEAGIHVCACSNDEFSIKTVNKANSVFFIFYFFVNL